MTHTTLAPEMVPLPRAPAVFGISRSGLYRLAADGRIRMVKIASRTMVDAASVRAFLATLPEFKPVGGKT
ncbi:helix-turn-helix domain-containing protein [Falsiroseomonas sp. HW251]|uniref:helix-turn-helix domain-containing protein n=1 Tax=Falsiroseomonas sp. HW251 TaxID=3390998 RepID=UPI003D31950B